jgi:hypothetical protein
MLQLCRILDRRPRCTFCGRPLRVRFSGVFVDADQPALRQTLKTTGERIERDITEYATLGAQATQLTKIAFDGVKQFPTRT